MSFTFENTKPEISDGELLEDIRRVSSVIARNGIVTREEYQREGKYGTTTVTRRFGSWSAATRAAGLEAIARKNIPDDELFDNLRQCWIGLGRQPRRDEMRPPISKFGPKPYVRRHGSWLKAMRAFCEIADDVDSGAVRLSDAATPKGPRAANLRLRFVVMRRDRFRCTNCGRSPATHPDIHLQVDHIFAWSKGGATELSNLRTLCSQCNLGKSNLDASERGGN
jgi:hypothetical protein